jgi:RND family efflux transporter MFP subunit
MMKRDTNASLGRCRTLLCALALTAYLVVGPTVWAGGNPGLGLAGAKSLEQFRKLSPKERWHLLEKAAPDGLLTHKVARAVLHLDVVERGNVEAARHSDIMCTLRSRTKGSTTASTIKWVIEDGTAVKKGEKVLELDDSALQVELIVRTVDFEAARAALVKAEENLKLVRTQNDIDVQLGENALRIAEVRLKRVKEDDRDLKEERALEVERARLGLQRVKAQLRAKETAARAEVAAKAAAADLERARKKEVELELSKCVLRAPQDGVVLYYVPEQSRTGQAPIVAQGEPVREGQKLLRIPDLAQLQLNVRVHEALVAHLRNEDPLNPDGWQQAEIRVDAFPRRVLRAHVKTVDKVASQQDWFAADVKVYKTVVALDVPLAGLKPGMSAEVRIHAERTPGPVLQVPVQAVVAVGKKRLCFVVTDKEVQEREVVLGLNNGGAVEVTSGLKEGEAVLLSPRSIAGRVAPRMDARTAAPAPILVRAVKPTEEGGGRAWVETYGLTHTDLDRIAALPGVREAVPVRTFPHDVRRLARTYTAEVVATTTAYTEVNQRKVAEGRFFTEDDARHRRNVVVLGSAVAEELFAGEEAVGATIVLGGSQYQVVGILREEDHRVSGAAAWRANRGIYIPLRTCQVRFGERILIRRGGRRSAEAVPLHAILVTVRDPGAASHTVENIREILEQAHPIKDWSVEAPAE